MYIIYTFIYNCTSVQRQWGNLFSVIMWLENEKSHNWANILKSHCSDENPSTKAEKPSDENNHYQDWMLVYLKMNTTCRYKDQANLPKSDKYDKTRKSSVFETNIKKSTELKLFNLKQKRINLQLFSKLVVLPTSGLDS